MNSHKKFRLKQNFIQAEYIVCVSLIKVKFQLSNTVSQHNYSARLIFIRLLNNFISNNEFFKIRCLLSTIYVKIVLFSFCQKRLYCQNCLDLITLGKIMARKCELIGWDSSRSNLFVFVIAHIHTMHSKKRNFFFWYFDIKQIIISLPEWFKLVSTGF